MSATDVIGNTQPRGTAKPWYRQLWAHVVAAMVIGVLLGHLASPSSSGFIGATIVVAKWENALDETRLREALNRRHYYVGAEARVV
jgi:Na+/H+-dicarboxylate symporter